MSIDTDRDLAFDVRFEEMAPILREQWADSFDDEDDLEAAIEAEVWLSLDEAEEAEAERLLEEYDDTEEEPEE